MADRAPMARSLIWGQIARPRMPLAYLDLNHFIFMARVRKGTAPAGYANLLKAARAAVEESRVLLPLSLEHLKEMSAIKDPRQRRDVADVMETLTRFQYLIGRVEIAQLEVDAGFRAIYGEPLDSLPVPLVGPGFGWALGMAGGLQLVNEVGDNVTESARLEVGPKKFDRLLQLANNRLDRAMLDGPADRDLERLRAAGYAPEVTEESHRSRLAYELELSKMLADSPKWRRGRLRDVITVREITHEWLDTINRVMQDRARRGLPIPGADEDGLTMQMIAAMPHSQVAISMKNRYHRDPSHRWTTNDITDIDALSVAFAYCDAVFTDHAARSALKDSRELRAIGTYLPKTPEELTGWLTRQPQTPGAGLLVTSARLPKPSGLSSHPMI